MKIGTDISIATCRESGYLVAEFKKRELVKNGKLDKNHAVHFTMSNPENWNAAGRPDIRRFDNNSGPYGSELYVYDTFLSFNDLIDLIGDQKDSIADFADWKNCKPNFEDPNEYDMLYLANDIAGYMGLE